MLHTPVLTEAILEWLRIRPDGTYVDATVGTGGHALEIVRRLTTGRLIGIDRDPQALEVARERLKEFEGRVTLVHREFSKIDEVLSGLKLVTVNGVIADLGVSSLQLDTARARLFVSLAGPLDMRMDPEQSPDGGRDCERMVGERTGRPALSVGEEHDSRRIARAIVRARPIRDTEHLATVVAGARKQGEGRDCIPRQKRFWRCG